MSTLEHLLARPDVLADPYPTYAELRERGPYQENGRWVFTSFEDCKELLRHSNLGKEPVGEAPPGMGPLFDMRRTWLARLNPPEHTRLRGLISQAFSVRAMRRLSDLVRSTSDELLERAQARPKTLSRSVAGFNGKCAI